MLIVAIPFILLLILIMVRSRKRRALINAEKEHLKNLYKDEAIFLCDDAEDPGDNLVALYGEPFRTSVRAGIEIAGLDGVWHTVKEVYANDKTPDKPDLEIPAGDTNSSIVFEDDNWNWNDFKEVKKRERVIAFKLR